MHETANNSATKPKAFGRPKKIKPGRPKILKTTKEEQVREAKKRYSQQTPETNRDAVRSYTEKHPEVNRATVRLYEDRHAGADQHFRNRARAYNYLFSFCALEISGGYRYPSGLCFFKIEGRMYHQVYSLDAPGQRFATELGYVQFVNRCRLYIDDGEERRNIAWVDHLILELLTPLPITWIRSILSSVSSGD
ncbi:hypothetical protein J6590_085830 [Homalodisca vitripennis]|nr:hypothetical protein J6590_085830 [Homalodisca vitripennis]